MKFVTYNLDGSTQPRFGFKKDDFVDGVDIGGAATFLEFAAESDIQLFI